MGSAAPPCKKLSICVPTYNRSKYLDHFLSILVPQVKRHQEAVELIISDNCSTDNTKEIVDRYSEEVPIIYSKNPSNLGCANLHLCIKQKSSGEFCWVVGDDDVLREGSVTKVLQIIEDNPDIDFIYVNYIIDSIPAEVKELAYSGKLSDKITDNMIGSYDLRERKVDRWENLLAEDMFSLTGMYSGISRLSVVREESKKIVIKGDFSDVETTYPHTMTYLMTMIGRKSYATGIPWVVCGTKSSWTKYNLAVRMRLYEMIQLQRKYGVPERIVEKQTVQFIQKNSATVLLNLLRSRMDLKDMPFAYEFSLPGLFLEFYRYKLFRVKFKNYIAGAIIRRIRN